MTAGAPPPQAGTGAPPLARWSDMPPRSRLPAERARRALVLGLIGLAAVLLWLRLLAQEPHLPLNLRPGADGRVVLAAGGDAALQAAVGQPLQALVLPDGTRLPADRSLLPQSARWTVDDAERRALLAVRAQLALPPAPGASSAFTVVLGSGEQAVVLPRPRGLDGLGTLCWALCALALGLYLTATRTLQRQPGAAARVYLLAATAQALNLLLMAAVSRPGIALAGTGMPADPGWGVLLDALTGAGLVHVLALSPQRLPRAHALGLLAWGVAAVVGVWLLLVHPPAMWWWAQGLALGAGLAAAWLLRPRGLARSPLARLQQRLVLAGTATLGLLSLAVALDGRSTPDTLANLGTVAWYVFFASLLMLGPHLSRARQVLREFMLLAGACTVAASLTLLCLAVFGLHPLGALVLVLAASLGLYALARPWVLGQLGASAALSPERMFDSLYRAARALEQSPGDAVRQLGNLLREVFDPLELDTSSRLASRVRVTGEGSTLVVPVLHPAGSERGLAPPAGAIVLRHARQGRRLFTAADGQLCERLLDQLARAVEHDRAVERGRAEERARIAQDLHDDIGARLLTLMYQAPDREIEAYIRHTLQDLKTLTRGLAASDQRLSHATAEWKADIAQRLAMAGCSLQWDFSADRDLRLSAVQWSALTRVLRELVNNIITHAQASRVEIRLQLDAGRLLLTVDDDGCGSAPAAWSHGLGLGGVRKRVKLLGGQVAWTQRDGGGIRCEVQAPLAGTADVADVADARRARR